MEERINENRKNYKPVALHCAKLYFCVQELPSLDPMYQFSMKWFKELFVLSFTYSPDKVKDTKGRVKQLKTDFLKVLYSNVCMSLFEQHKLMFAFNMAIKLNEEDEDTHTKEHGGLKIKEVEMLQHMHGTHQASSQGPQTQSQR